MSGLRSPRGKRDLIEEHVKFESDDGVVLSGVYGKIRGTLRACIILAHGIMTHKDYAGFYPRLAMDLSRHGFESLRFQGSWRERGKT